jgi:hypothetical protein
LLSVENEEFWKGSEPLQFGRLPCLQVINYLYDTFDVFFYPHADTDVCFPVIIHYSCSQTKIQAACNCNKVACNIPCWSTSNALKVSVRAGVLIHSLLQMGQTLSCVLEAVF